MEQQRKFNIWLGRGSIGAGPLLLAIRTHRIILWPGGGYSLKIIAHCTPNKSVRPFDTEKFLFAFPKQKWCTKIKLHISFKTYAIQNILKNVRKNIVLFLVLVFSVSVKSSVSTLMQKA